MYSIGFPNTEVVSMEDITIQLEYQKMLLDMINREWDFMYDVIKTVLSSLLITIPIYLSIIGFLISLMKPSIDSAWIIGPCISFLIMIILLVYYNYVGFVGERIQLSKR